MIVRDSGTAFAMTSQHDHALLSADIAKFLATDLFGIPSYRNEVLTAIAQHDRAWLGLDAVPIWNDRRAEPYSFMDYPLYPKQLMYRKGLDEVERMNPYAGLLCSLHYTSFSHLKSSNDADVQDYMARETNRRAHIRAKFDVPDSAAVERHVRLLQLCDELSLYVCMNEPGASKADEHPWYQSGFETKIGGQTILAGWLDDRRISLFPYLLQQPCRVALQTKHVAKERISRIGIEQAYHEAAFSEQVVEFVPGSLNSGRTERS